MELDDMKQAWQTLDLRLQKQHELNVQLFHDSRLDRMRRGRRPLAWGQALQILLGVLWLLLLVPMYIPHWRDPVVLAAGVVVHLYGIGMIVIGAIVEGHIARIDYTVPVLDLQKRLASLRRTYAVFGTIFVGLPWCFLTAPLLIVLTQGRIMHAAPLVVWIQLAIGAVLLAITAWVYRWTRRPERAHMGRWIARSSTGASIRRAQSILDEIARFERE